MLYCPWSGQELLSALGVIVMCQDSKNFLMPCGNCSWSYIGETGRSFATRKKEHIRNVKTAAKGSRIANHAWSHDHVIDFNNASIIDIGSSRSSGARKLVFLYY